MHDKLHNQVFFGRNGKDRVVKQQVSEDGATSIYSQKRPLRGGDQTGENPLVA
jgi:hypothetical protein